MRNSLLRSLCRWGLNSTILLDRIIGEDKTLSIKVGAEAGDPSTEDVILVRGVSADVDRAVKDILRIVDDAKNDAVVSSYVSLLLFAPYRIANDLQDHGVRN